MYNSTDIAQRINNLLKEQKKSQKDMLEKCDLGKNAISSMLSRGSMPHADSLAKIADYLDCSIDILMGREKYLTKISTPEFISKLNCLSEDSQTEILHMIDYKYEQLQKKRKESSSPSESTPPKKTLHKLA